MATDLDDRPSTDAGSDASNPAQQHYDDTFNKLTSREHMGKDGKSGDKGLYNPGGEGGDKDDKSTNDKKQGKLAKAKGLYNKAGDARSRFKNRLGGLLNKKWLVGVGIGGGGMVTVLMLLLLLFGALKIPHLAENITAYQFARVTQQMSRNSTRILSEKISIASAKRAAYNKLEQRYGTKLTKVKDTWSKLDRFRPNKIIRNLNGTGQAQFEYRTIGDRQVLAGIRTGDTSIPIKKYGFVKGLIPGYKLTKNVSFAKEVAPRLNTALKANNVGPIIRGKVAKKIRQDLGISLIAWKVGEYKGKSAEKARLQFERESAKRAGTGSGSKGVRVASLASAIDDAEEENKKILTDDKAAQEAIDNDGKVKGVVKSITDSFKESKFQTALGVANTAYAVATPLCIIYEGSITQSGPSIDQQMTAQQQAYYLTAAAADQQKDGTDGSAEATGAFNEKLGDISNSIPMRRASGGVVDTSGYISAEAGSAGVSYSIADLLPGKLGSFTNWAADKFCPALTNTGVALTVAGLNIATLFIPGVGQGVKAAEEGAKKVATSAIGRFAQKIADRILLKRGESTAVTKSLNVSSKVSDVITDGVKSGAKIAGATVLAKMIVVMKAGYANNGLEQQNDFVAMADAGGNIAANEVNRQGLYGAPLNKTEANIAATESLAYVNDLNQQKGAYQRYVALSNPQSLLSKFTMRTASVLSSFKIPSLLKGLGNLLDPSVLFSNLFGLLNPASVHAAASADASTLNYGNIQFGFTTAERALIDKDSSYGPLANQEILDESGREDDVADTYGDCFTKTIGELLADGKIKTNEDGDVKNDGGNPTDDSGLCAPNNLSFKNGEFGDLVFRYRVAHSYDTTLDQLQEAEEVTNANGIAEGTKFRVATYNVLGASHTDPGGDSSAGPWDQRIKKVEQNIKDKRIDIVGFQEFQNRQQSYIKTHMKDYEMTSWGKSDDRIMWRTSCGNTSACTSFTKVGQGTWSSTYFNGPINEPWVKLQDNETGQEVYVMNVHDPINRGQGSASTRYQNALKHLAQIKKLNGDAPVVLTGDFNNGYTKSNGSGMPSDQKTTYCVLTSSGQVNEAYDLSTGRQEKCPNPLPRGSGIGSTIDHIYFTNEVSVTAYADIDKPQSGSDHVAIYADAVIGGSGAGVDFSLATWNLPASKKTGYTSAEEQWRLGTNSIKSYNNGGDKGVDVVGFQETGRGNFAYYKKNLTGYDSYPSTYPKQGVGGHDGTCAASQAIFFKKSKFQLVKAAYLEFERYITWRGKADCNNGGEVGKTGYAHAPIVWLKTPDGQQVIVMNIHNVANVPAASGSQPAKIRYESNKLFIQKIQSLQQQNPGVPIFLTGDFNEGTDVRTSGNVTYQHKQSNLIFCMFASNGLMKSANGPAMKCDPKYGVGGVDYVYVPKDVTTSTTLIKRKANGSDHDSAIVANIKVSGSGTNNTKAASKRPPSAKVQKILTVIVENHSYTQMKRDMPYTFELAQDYGYATNYKALTHPSLPNYIAIAGGAMYGVNGDGLPSAYNVNGTSIFKQAISKGKTAKLYAESMSGNCNTTSAAKGSLYRTKHNPWAYFKNERALCNKFDVPYGQFASDVSAGKLPNVGMVIPNMCNDGHDCSLTTADSWFDAMMQKVMNGPDWKSGKLAVILTADEDDRGSANGNDVLTVVIHPSLFSKVTSTKLTHYSLSRFYSEVAGASGLRNAASAPSLSKAFGLPL